MKNTPKNAAANWAVEFINSLTCGSGDHIGQPLKLRKWQENLVRQIFGTLRKDKSRLFRTCLLYISRKNGKSTLIAACCLAELFSGKAGQQILIVAGDRNQASITWDIMEKMLRHPSAKWLFDKVEINKTAKRIAYPDKHSFIQAMSSVAGTKLGFNPSMLVFDEYLVQQNRDLWDTLTSGSGARSEWFTWIVSTAGDDRASPMYEELVRAQRIAADPKLDPTYLPVLYYATEEEAEGEKWLNEDLWKKVNPSLGDITNLDFLREKARIAKDLPYEERIFRQRYLNQFVDASDKCWIPAAAWAKCKADLPDLHGQPCCGAVDCSKVSDLSAFSLVFPLTEGRFAVKSWAWIPHDTLRKHEKKDHANYFQWVQQGWLRTCPGVAIDYPMLRRDLGELITEWKPMQVLWDRSGADYLIQELAHDGVPMFQFGQGSLSMSQPTKEFERLALTGNLLSDGNPVLAWCVANVQLEIGPTELVKPSKGRSTGRIDCAQAAIMALAGALGATPRLDAIFDNRDLLMSLLPNRKATAAHR